MRVARMARLSFAAATVVVRAGGHAAAGTKPKHWPYWLAF